MANQRKENRLTEFYSTFQRSDTLLRRSYDALLSFLVELNVVLSWHGLWSILDIWAEKQKHSHEKTAWISFGIGTFVNMAIFFTQFPYSTYADDIFTKSDTKSQKSQLSILHWIWVHFLGFIFSILCLVSAVNTFR